MAQFILIYYNLINKISAKYMQYNKDITFIDHFIS